jgi:hypothetical protein
MENAFSLIRLTSVSADSAEYRQNLDDQLVCPECYEQVFKKQMWVPSQHATTHFFSHYAGKFNSCSLRTPNDNIALDKSDSLARLQKLREFNQRFRSEIIKAFKNIIGKSLTKPVTETLDFAQRISDEMLKVGDISKLSKKLIVLLSEPITDSIDESLEDLEEDLCPIYWHLTTPHGESNLYFVTATAILLAYHSESYHLEELLSKKFLKRTSYLDETLLGNSVLLLAHYINWSGSLKPVTNFVKEHDFPLRAKEEPSLSRNTLNAKVKRDDSKKEHIQYCSACNNPFISKGDKNCSYCAWKARTTPSSTDRPLYPNLYQQKSWLESQPWDEDNLRAHEDFKKQNQSTSSEEVDDQ